MIRFGLVAAIAGTIVAVMAGPAWADWRQPLDAPVDADASAHARSAVGTTLDGVPYLAWTEGTESASEIRVARLSPDGSWTPVGGSLNRAPGSLAIEPAIAAVGGTVFVAWSERATESGRFQIHVSRLTGDGFEPAGGDVNRSSAVEGRDPSLVDFGGVPHVAWTEPDAENFEVIVARLDGEVWSAVGGLVNHSSREAAAAGALGFLVDQWSAEEPELAVANGVLHVAWVEQGDVRVARLTGGAWAEYGTDEPPVYEGSAAQVDLAAVGGVPFVAWRQASGRFEVHVARLGDEGAWTGVGGGAVNPTGMAEHPSLLPLGGTLWLGLSQGGDVRVTRLDAAGTAWAEPVAAALDDVRTNGVGAPSLFDAGGIPWVAWSEGIISNRHDVRASRLVPDFLSTEVTARPKTSTFVTRLRTFGLAYDAGFAWGRQGTGLPSRTPLVRVAGEETMITATVPTKAAKPYEVQPLAFAGPEARGEVVAFTTPKFGRK